MKRRLIATVVLIISVLFVACENKNDTKDWEPTPHELVNDFKGVSMVVKEDSVTPTGLTIVFENNSDEQGIYSDDFLLEKKINNDWYQVPPLMDEYGFNDIGYDLLPSEKEELVIEWSWLYGSLDPSEYRIIKTVLDFRVTGDFDEYYLAAEFAIE